MSANPRMQYRVRAAACPQVVPALLGLFARQDQLCDRVEAVRLGDAIDVRIALRGLGPERAAIIAEKMREMVMVEQVMLDLGRPIDDRANDSIREPRQRVS